MYAPPGGGIHFYYIASPGLTGIHRTLGTFNRNKEHIWFRVNTLDFIIPFMSK